MPGTRKQNKKQAQEARIKALLLASTKPQGQRDQLVRIDELLSTDELRQYLWLHMIADPWGPVTRMPLILGNGVWDEDLYRYHMYGEIVVNSSLGGFALLGQENWYQSIGQSSCNYLAPSSVGKPLYCTNASFVGSSSPIAGAAAATGSVGTGLASDTTYGGANPTLYTHVLQTASALRVQPLSNSDTLAGEVMIAWTRDVVVYPLEGVPFTTVRGYPDDVVVKKIMPLEGWKNDHWLELSAIPLEREAFDSIAPLAAGTVTQPYAALGVFIEGAASATSLRVEAVAVYQIETNGSNEVADAYSTATQTHGADPPADKWSSTARGILSPEKAMMSSERMARSITSRYAPTSRMGRPHPRDPRTQIATSSLVHSNPTLGSRIKGALSKGWNYVKNPSNWLDMLLGAAKIVPQIAPFLL